MDFTSRQRRSCKIGQEGAGHGSRTRMGESTGRDKGEYADPQSEEMPFEQKGIVLL